MLFDCFGVRFVPSFSKKSPPFKMAKKQGSRTNIGTTLVHITYPPLVNLKIVIDMTKARFKVCVPNFETFITFE